MKALSLVSLLALSLVACAASSEDDQPTTSDTASGADEEVKAAVIGEKQAGKTIDVQAGRSFTIALSSNASTGYQWHVKSVDRTIGSPKESTVPGDASRPGSAGTQKFTWSTKSPLNMVGQHTITLEYQRPWAETSPPVKTFTVTINVVDATAAKKCGGFAGLRCGSDEYCDFSANAQACGMADGMGTCSKRGEFCPEYISTVCGCDNKEYGNPCFANVAGTSVAHQGACAKN